MLLLHFVKVGAEPCRDYVSHVSTQRTAVDGRAQDPRTVLSPSPSQCWSSRHGPPTLRPPAAPTPRCLHHAAPFSARCAASAPPSALPGALRVCAATTATAAATAAANAAPNAAPNAVPTTANCCPADASSRPHACAVLG